MYKFKYICFLGILTFFPHAVKNGERISQEITIFDPKTNSTFYTSDRNFKKNIELIESKRALEIAMKLRGRTFEWKFSGESDVGFVAQEVQEIIPELVSEVGEGEGRHLAVKYGNVVAIAIEAIKFQQSEIEKLKEEIKKLGENK